MKYRNEAVKSQSMNKMIELECGPMPNVMVALPNIGGALINDVIMT